MKLLKNLKAEFLWWRWLNSGPVVSRLVDEGVDKQSRQIIYRRHDALAPPKPEWRKS